MSEELDFEPTFGEQAELEELEILFSQAQEQMWQGLGALSKINELRLWRFKFKSFKEYCEQRWGLTSRRVQQLMKAYDVRSFLSEDIAKLITNERQARALADVDPEQREGVVRNAASRGPVTADSLAAAAPVPGPRQRVPRQIELDEIGTPIPDDALPFWKRRQEANDLIFQLVQIKSIVKKGNETLDPFYLKCGNSTLMELTSAYQHLIELKPYAVCTQCQGSPSLQPDGCNFCKNSGLISKRQWDTQSMQEVKDMRLKANNARNGKH